MQQYFKMNKIKNLVTIFVLLFWNYNLVSEEVVLPQDKNGNNNSTYSNLAMGIDFLFNHEDCFIGGTFYILISNPLKISLPLSINVRPYHKNVLLKESAFEYYLLREFRTIYTLGLEKEFSLFNNYNLFISILGGWYRNYYSGSSKDFTKTLIPVIQTGFIFPNNLKRKLSKINIQYRLGYQYCNFMDNRHKIYISFIFGKN